MTNISLWMLASAVFALIGLTALIVSNKSISTRHKATQGLFVAMGVGGLMGIVGSYEVGLTIAVVAFIAYVTKYLRFKKDQQECLRKGTRLPEYKKL